jgi:hypothetical protein
MNRREANLKEMWREDRWERKANGIPPMLWRDFKKRWMGEPEANEVERLMAGGK